MKRVALLCLFVWTAIAQKRPIAHEDVWLMKRVGEPVVSPDGRQVVFSLVEPDYDAAKQTSDLWIVPADGSAAPRRLTATRAPESGAVWSPDGTRLAFSTRREGDEASQIYVLSLQGGEAQRVTSAAGGASNPQWRPDGKAILFESDFDPIAGERKSRKTTARVYDTMPVRYWNAWLDEKKPHVFVQDLAGGAARDVLQGSKLAASAGFAGIFQSTGGQTLQAVWSPDGRNIVFTAIVNRADMMHTANDTALFAVAAEGGEPRRISEAGVAYAKPQFARNGGLYALQEKLPEAGGRLYSISRLARMSWPEPGRGMLVAGSWDRSVGGFSFSRDGREIYLEAEDDGFDQIFHLPVAGGAPERLFAPKRGGYTAARDAAGGLVALYQTSSQPAEVVRVSSGGQGRALTSFNADRVAQFDAPEPVHFWFTAKNGKRIHNLMILPPKFDAAKKYPLLIFPHGGPNSMSKDAFSTRWNNYLLASPGYVVLETNYTGSTGFGEKFADDIEKDVLKGPAQEILEGIDEAIRRYPYIDGTRQAAAGASYGGYLMNWFNGHTNQFKCIVNHAGAINNESQYGVNDGGLDRELRMGGPIWEKRGQWIEQSPITYSGKFHTPMLVTQGELDYRVPVNESLTTFKLLQRLKVPSRLVVFPDEGHWIQKGENSRAHMQEVLGWLARYL
jgi:dipeptidyl aminopeptidase/acylaminoacyl peptidase